MKKPVVLPSTPEIDGLCFRKFQGESDFPQMAELIDACKEVDGLERATTIEDIQITYRHLENCDPNTDMLFAEINGKVIAYGRLWWDDLLDGTRLYHPFGFLHPEFRKKGIGSIMWDFAEKRITEIASTHPREIPKFYQVEPFESEFDLIGFLERRGYLPCRYETHMVRDLSELFPEALLPDGLEVRPVKTEHLRAIFLASNEAFRDHWGSRDESEEEYKAEMENPDFHPELWKVAWAGNEVASVIHNFIDVDENAEYARKRGYTEGICTRRPWRKKGVARSLLVQSMKMFKDMGMTETALSVDSENISGATRLYEGVGYKKVKQQIIYRKPVK